MKIHRKALEVYKWTPFWLAVCYLMNIYLYHSSQWRTMAHLVFFFVILIPYIFVNCMVVRHIYTRCKSKERDNYYGL